MGAREFRALGLLCHAFANGVGLSVAIGRVAPAALEGLTDVLASFAIYGFSLFAPRFGLRVGHGVSKARHTNPINQVLLRVN